VTLAVAHRYAFERPGILLPCPLPAGRKIRDARGHPRLCRKCSMVHLRSIYDISLTAMVYEPESPYIVAEHHMMCFFYT
jgi:hypothetical protein